MAPAGRGTIVGLFSRPKTAGWARPWRATAAGALPVFLIPMTNLPMDPRVTTVTLVVVSARLGRELAWMVAVPPVTPVTGTFTLDVPPEMVTVFGTLATAELLDDRLITTPATGALPLRLRVRF